VQCVFCEVRTECLKGTQINVDIACYLDGSVLACQVGNGNMDMPIKCEDVRSSRPNIFPDRDMTFCIVQEKYLSLSVSSIYLFFLS
jgi:hypothetical protein